MSEDGWEMDRWDQDAQHLRWDRADERERAQEQQHDRLTRDRGESGQPARVAVRTAKAA